MEDIKVTVIKYPDRDNLVMRYTDPMTGKHVARSTGTSSKKDAIKAAGKWEDELRTGRYQKLTRITWADFKQRYEDDRLASLSDGTAIMASVMLNHVDRVLNPKFLSGLTASAISEFQTKLRAEGMRDTTLAGYLRYLHSAMAWAVSQDMLPKVPSFDMPKRAKGITKAMRGRPITTEEYERMVAAVPSVRKRDAAKWVRLLEGLWLSGLRLSEALSLSWDDDAAVSVHLQGKYPKLRIWAEGEKAHEDRLLPIAPEFAEFLMKTPEADRCGLVFGIEGVKKGEPMDRNSAGGKISTIGKKAGVVVNKADEKFASAHDLRRAFGTRWSKRVMPATLQKLMRHSDIGTTMRFYVEHNADDVSAELFEAHRQLGNKTGNTHPVAATEGRSADA